MFNFPKMNFLTQQICANWFWFSYTLGYNRKYHKISHFASNNKEY